MAVGKPVFIRFQGAVPNARGSHPGLFALANGLAGDGLLSPADEAWLRAANADFTRSCTDPSTVETSCYDRQQYPGARAWFRAGASDQLAQAFGYLDLLNRYRVPWSELRTASPGVVVYEDDVQVVAVPEPTWPF